MSSFSKKEFTQPTIGYNNKYMDAIASSCIVDRPWLVESAERSDTGLDGLLTAITDEGQLVGCSVRRAGFSLGGWGGCERWRPLQENSLCEPVV